MSKHYKYFVEKLLLGQNVLRKAVLFNYPPKRMDPEVKLILGRSIKPVGPVLSYYFKREVPSFLIFNFYFRISFDDYLFDLTVIINLMFAFKIICLINFHFVN